MITPPRAIAEYVPRAEILRSLGRLVRGLSALFWGLPLCVIACARTASADLVRSPALARGNELAELIYAILPVTLTTGLILYGLTQMRHFQRQERVWRHALERTQLLAVANVGLAPFLFFWNRAPEVTLYVAGFILMLISALLFLFNLNQALQRLAAMLPDETLRTETKLFTSVNLWLLCALVAVLALYIGLGRMDNLPWPVIKALQLMERSRAQLLAALALFPLAMTMTLIWKTKEVVFASVFGDDWSGR